MKIDLERGLLWQKIVNLFLFAVHGVIMLMTVSVWEVYGIFVGGLWEAECDA